MKLKIYNKITDEIKTIHELEVYMKTHIYVDFKKIPDKLLKSSIELLKNDTLNKTEFHKRIRKIFSENGTILSKYQREYWINRGYADEYVDIMISESQKKNSPRCTEYWQAKGLTFEEATHQVSELQREYGNVNKNIDIELLRSRSIFSTEYWVLNHNYSIDDAINTVSNIQSGTSKKYWNNITPDQAKRHIHIGSKNGMFGKPSPIKSGNGYSGWYNGLFFRSLRELNYMVNVLEKRNISYETAETKFYRIEYTSYNGVKRTYCGDFIVADRYYVEIKPKRLFNTVENTLKRNAAVKFCKDNNLIYKMTDCGIIKYNQLFELIENGSVILTKNTERKLNQYLLKNTK
jgi:hypothetical protein